MTRANKSLLQSVLFVAFSVALIVIWISMIKGNDPARAWRGLLISYLFFTTAAAGLVVWPAIVVVSEGEWMEPLEKICRIGMIFSIPSIAALLVLWIGSDNWSPWLNVEKNKVWLNNTFLFSRNLILLLLFWVMVFYFVANRYKKNRITIATWLILIYVITFSITGFDLVMALNPDWHSMMMGGYIFINGLYTAATAWAFIAILSGKPDKNSLLDVGRLIVAFSLLTTYLMFSQLLPIWYENLPDEINFVIPMFNYGWKQFSYVIIFLVYLGPLILLMSKGSKRNYKWLGIVTFFLLMGLWLEKWWIVSSVFERHKVLFGWSEVIPGLIFLSLIIAGVPFVINYNHKEQVNDE